MRLWLFCFVFALSVATSATRVAPLLKGWVRHQFAPFNRYCPLWTDANGTTYEQHCQVGCVATALEEIISYHGRPIVLLDTLKGRKTKNYTIEDALPGLTIDVPSILPRYDADGYSEASLDAVARLSQICGTAAKMNYGLASSGANVANLIEPLRKAFGWKSVAYLDSYKYAPKDWEELLRNELRAGRPVLYTGYTMNINGHAFVLDGCDEEGRFHFNFGYGGAYDEGWFRLDELSVFEHQDDITATGIPQGFFCNQMALLLAPDSIDFQLPDTLSRTGKEIAVEQMRWSSPPEAGKFSPLEVTFRNTTSQTLTTPFEIFTNLPSDTLIFRQGDYGALYGLTLAPGEIRTVTIHCKFKTAGERLLRVSPDDIAVIAEQAVHVLEPNDAKLEFGVPSVEFPDATTAQFSLTVTNKGTGRSGESMTFCLMPTADIIPEGDYRHYEYVYLQPGESRRITTTFRHLTPGATQTFAVRCPWTLQQQLTFTVPTVDAIEIPTLNIDSTTPTYDLSGRRAQESRAGAILIRKGQKILQ